MSQRPDYISSVFNTPHDPIQTALPSTKRKPTDELIRSCRKMSKADDAYHHRYQTLAPQHDSHSHFFARLPPIRAPEAHPLLGAPITNPSFGVLPPQAPCLSVTHPPYAGEEGSHDTSNGGRPRSGHGGETGHADPGALVSGALYGKNHGIEESLPKGFQPDRDPVPINLAWHQQDKIFFQHPERLPKSRKEQKRAVPVPEGVRIVGWKGTFAFGRLYLGFKTTRGLYTWLDKTVAEDMQHFVSHVLSVTQGHARVERARNVFRILDKCTESGEEDFRDQVRKVVCSERVAITYREVAYPVCPPPAVRNIQPREIYFDICLLAVMYKVMERSPERFVERDGCPTRVIFGHSLEDWFRSWTACRLFRIRRRPSHLSALVSTQGPSKEEEANYFGYRGQSFQG